MTVIYLTIPVKYLMFDVNVYGPRDTYFHNYFHQRPFKWLGEIITSVLISFG